MSVTDIVYPTQTAPLYPHPSVDHPGRADSYSGEILPLIRESGLVYGRACRDYCHSGSKVLHPVVHLHILDRLGSLYLQKRSASKDLFPGRWDTAVGGHVIYGEQVPEALYREADEELALQAFNPHFLGTDIWETERDREFVFRFAAIGHPELAPNPAEVSEGRWWSTAEIDAALGSGIFTPNFEAEYSAIRESLFALL